MFLQADTTYKFGIHKIFLKNVVIFDGLKKLSPSILENIKRFFMAFLHIQQQTTDRRKENIILECFQRK